jgi:CRP/FNR family transcriptional regulator, dissimilatory nitrate respiration regulator
VGRRAGGQAGRRAGGQAGRRAGGQAGRRAGRQAGGQAGPGRQAQAGRQTTAFHGGAWGSTSDDSGAGLQHSAFVGDGAGMLDAEEYRDIVRLLGGLGIFKGLPLQTLERIARRCAVRTVPERTLLFRKGEPCHGLYVVIEGRVRIYRANRDGKEQVLHQQGPGQALAEVPLFDGGPCPASARAVENSRLLFLPRQEFEELYRAEPVIATAVIRDLGRRLRGAVGLIEKISLRDVPSRVGLTLLEFAEASAAAAPSQSREGARRVPPSRPGGESSPVDRSLPFDLPRTQGELAEALATTRESVARALRTLREEGLIEQEGARVRIPDPDALEARCWGV